MPSISSTGMRHSPCPQVPNNKIETIFFLIKKGTRIDYL
jgi:hypothetical protein